MQLPEWIDEYLQDERFDSGLVVPIQFDSQDEVYRSRQDWLVAMAEGLRVVHVGCVDHNVEMVEQKIRRGKWLHKRLSEVAERCLGVDFQSEGIRHLRDTLGYDDLIHADILEAALPEASPGQPGWDLMLVAEVLEHINDPVAFLTRLRERHDGRVQRLAVSVPNAFTRANLHNARRGREVINSDHRYWFTPYTLCKVLTQAGFGAIRLRACRNGVVKRRSMISNLRPKRSPLLRDTLIAECRFPASV